MCSTRRFYGREVMCEVAADYPDIELTHMYVDNAAMQMVRNPGQFDTIVTGNLFGDILSDQASMCVGSIGLAGIGFARRGTQRAIRAHTRQRARYSRAGYRQPHRHAAVRGHDAAFRFRYGRHGRANRIRREQNACGRMYGTGYGRHGEHARYRLGSERQIVIYRR